MEAKILWVDDEVDFLKPHILFLKDKGYIVDTLNNGYDALEQIKEQHYDLVILDEMMPGLTGLETLAKMKEIAPTVPVVMVTKSEQESIMDIAIGSNISDYIIKPVNPNQVLLAIKKIVHKQQLVTEQSTADYRRDFNLITELMQKANSYTDWQAIYKKIVVWDVELNNSSDKNILEILTYQKREANVEFAKFIKRNYISWFDENNEDKPTMSHTLMRNNVLPIVDKSTKTTFFLIDNFRYDQWLEVRPFLKPFFNIDKEDFYYSILPTATQYARNSIFAGLMPSVIKELMPHLWVDEFEEGPKNGHEEELLQILLKKSGKNYKMVYEKLVRPEAGKKLVENFDKITNADFSVIVYNFLDILSHARTDTDIIRELADDEAAFRNLTKAWFEYSNLFEMMRELSAKGHTIIITSDHGTMRVDNPVKVIGDRETSANLRYKMGKNLNYNPKEVFAVTEPEKIFLPKGNLSSTYIFATEQDFLAYPNNHNYYVKYYKNTFQHGGVSMEEMIVPFIVLSPK